MKLNKNENKALSDAIDQIQDGLNHVVELYNESEIDQLLIKFEDHVIDDVKKAKKMYGDNFIDQKLNNLVKEVISFLPLDDETVQIENEEKEKKSKTNKK